MRTPNEGSSSQYAQYFRPANYFIVVIALLAAALGAFAGLYWSSNQLCRPISTTQAPLVSPLHAPNAAGGYLSGQAATPLSLDSKSSIDVMDIPEPTQFAPSFPENRNTAHHSGVQTLQEEVAFLRNKVLELRQAYGLAHCAVNGIGPNGGFCVKKTDTVGKVSGTLCDEAMCRALAGLLAGQRVADLGAGRGQYGKCLVPAVKQYVPYDGSEGIGAVTDGFVHFLDLSEPTWLGVSFDWVISLEVGEHIPAKHQDTYIGNVVRHAEKGVVLSWAIPGQGGHHHINEQPLDYIAGRVTAVSKGRLVLNQTASEALRSAASFAWFKNTIMVFHRV